MGRWPAELGAWPVWGCGLVLGRGRCLGAWLGWGVAWGAGGSD